MFKYYFFIIIIINFITLSFKHVKLKYGIFGLNRSKIYINIQKKPLKQTNRSNNNKKNDKEERITIYSGLV